MLTIYATYHSPWGYSCDSYYIADASYPWNGRTASTTNPGRYIGQCRLLLHWSYILTVAGSITIFRAFIQAIPVYRPS